MKNSTSYRSPSTTTRKNRSRGRHSKEARRGSASQTLERKAVHKLRRHCALSTPTRGEPVTPRSRMRYRARTDLWEPGEGNLPRPPDRTRGCLSFWPTKCRRMTRGHRGSPIRPCASRELPRSVPPRSFPRRCPQRSVVHITRDRRWDRRNGGELGCRRQSGCG
jgi:hypothetical protein